MRRRQIFAQLARGADKPEVPALEQKNIGAIGTPLSPVGMNGDDYIDVDVEMLRKPEPIKIDNYPRMICPYCGKEGRKGPIANHTKNFCHKRPLN